MWHQKKEIDLFVPIVFKLKKIVFRLHNNSVQTNEGESWQKRLQALLQAHKESRLTLTSALHNYTATVVSSSHLKHPSSMSKNVDLPNPRKPTRGADIKIVMKVPTKLFCLSTVNPLDTCVHTAHLATSFVWLCRNPLSSHCKYKSGGRRYFKAPYNFKRPKGWGYLQVSRVDTKATTNSESRHWRGCSFLCINIYIYTRQDATRQSRSSKIPRLEDATIKNL